MRSARLFVLALVPILALGGCASDDPAPDDTRPTPGSAPTTGGTPSGSEPPASSLPWAAYQLDETVTPRSGRAGKIQSFAYTSTEGGEGERTVLDVRVEVLGTSTENVRSQRLDLTSGEQVTTTAPMEVTKLKHTITVRQDDSGEQAPGDSAIVTLWLPTEESASPGMFLWRYVHLDYEDEGATGTWEYAADPSGQQMTVPYTEGVDPSSWWGFNHLLATYGLSWWAGLFAADANLEEGSYNFGGFAYESKRETLRVGDYTFDGWRVTWSAGTPGESADFTVAVAPTLPLPVEQDFGSTDGSGGSRTKFELTDLDLG